VIIRYLLAVSTPSIVWVMWCDNSLEEIPNWLHCLLSIQLLSFDTIFYSLFGCVSIVLLCVLAALAILRSVSRRCSYLMVLLRSVFHIVDVP
jgi:hypothetical protein